MNLLFFSKIISRSFDFYTWFPVGLLVAIFRTGLSYSQIKTLSLVLLVLEVILPISLFFLVLKKKKISDIDVTKRKERYGLFGFMTVILAVSCIVAYFLGNHLFFVLQLAALALGLTIFLITFRFKISGHMLMNVSSIYVINYLFGWKLLWLFLIIPLVAFARIYLKKHTLAQVLLGLILGIAEPYLILKFFRLI
ncbi:MAG: hypothetical protein AAB512_03900 [Patescibacteria group bacterium]